MIIKNIKQHERDKFAVNCRWILILLSGIYLTEVQNWQQIGKVIAVVLASQVALHVLLTNRLYERSKFIISGIRISDILLAASLNLMNVSGKGYLYILAGLAVFLDSAVSRSAIRNVIMTAACALLTAGTLDFVDASTKDILPAVLMVVLGGICGWTFIRFRNREEVISVNGKRLAVLLKCSTALANSKDLRTMMFYGLKAMVNDFEATGGYINLVSSDEPGTLVTEVVYSEAGEFEFPEKVEMGTGISGYVAKMLQPIALRSDSGTSLDCDGISVNVSSAVCVPLLNRSFGAPGQAATTEVLGAITIFTATNKKSSNIEELELLQGLAALLSTAISNHQMEERQRATNLRTLQSLATALEARDDYTRGHSQRVCELSIMIGQRIGFNEEALEELRIGTILHDIGKIGVPDNILNKPGRLDNDEFQLMKQHPVIGYEICKPLMLSEGVLMIIRNHHEKLDGTGYPDGLKGGELPLMLRIVCVADAFDAMSSRRPYRGVMDTSVVLGELAKGAGLQFDPVVVEHLKGLLHTGQLDELYKDFWVKPIEEAA